MSYNWTSERKVARTGRARFLEHVIGFIIVGLCDSLLKWLGVNEHVRIRKQDIYCIFFWINSLIVISNTIVMTIQENIYTTVCLATTWPSASFLTKESPLGYSLCFVRLDMVVSL